jgi:hypothetical protein
MCAAADGRHNLSGVGSSAKGDFTGFWSCCRLFRPISQPDKVADFLIEAAASLGTS